MKTDKVLLSRAEDRISCLYIEKARIEQTEFSVQIVQGRNTTELPITTIDALFLGPGTTITQQAIKNICDAAVTIIWCGQEPWRYYAFGEPATHSSKNMLKQIACHESKTLHAEVVRKMYKLRYPEDHLSRKTLSELRGIEGNHVKNLYQELAKKYNVEWSGRNYRVDDFYNQDEINQALTATNQILYGIIRGVIHIMGFLPAIGFIHTGDIDSFVFDMADLYKERISIPVSFRVVSEHPFDLDDTLRREMRKEIYRQKLMKQIPKDLIYLFGETETSIKEIEMGLWDYGNIVKFGKNYGNQ